MVHILESAHNTKFEWEELTSHSGANNYNIISFD